MNVAIVLLQSLIDKVGKASQFKAFHIQPPLTPSWNLCEEPAQTQAYIQQEKAQPNQQETIRWVARGRPTAHLSCTAIAGFDAEASTIGSSRLAWRQIKVDQDEDHPISAASHTSRTFGGGEHATDCQVSSEGSAVLTLEGMRCQIAFVACAQSPCPSCTPRMGQAISADNAF